MRNRILIVACIFFIFPHLSLSAETGENRKLSLSLEQAWEMMKESHGELRKLYTEWHSALRKADGTDQWIPSITAGASLNRTSPFISRSTMPSSSVSDESEYWTVRGSLDMQLKITPGLSAEEELRQLKAELADLKIAGRIELS